MMMPFGIVRVDRDGAPALGDGTAHVLELHGGVRDVEALGQDFVDAPQDAVAGGGRDVLDQHMAAQRVRARPEAPDVQVVDVQDAVDRAHPGGDILEVNPPRQALQQDVERLARDVPGAPHH